MGEKRLKEVNVFFLFLNDPAYHNNVELSESHISKGDFSSTVALGAKWVLLF